VLCAGPEGDDTANPLLAKAGEAVSQDIIHKLVLPKAR
jgi:hypothetical protein